MFLWLSLCRVDFLPYFWKIQVSSFTSTGCSTNWVTRFCRQLKNHWCRGFVPFSVCFFSTSSVSRLFESWSYAWPMIAKKSTSILRDFQRIANTFWDILSPLDFMKHPHKDNSFSEFFRMFFIIFEFKNSVCQNTIFFLQASFAALGLPHPAKVLNRRRHRLCQ